MNYDSAERNQSWITVGQPKLGWHWAAGFLGLPAETYSRSIKHPIVITSIIAIFIAVNLFSQTYGDQLFALSYGFIPALWYRLGFITIFTSFFMHGGWLHLLGNAYYFYIFGDDICNELSVSKLCFLLFGAHITGLLVHIVMGGNADIPLVGASAGISGLLGYYMYQYPYRRISYMIFFLFTHTLWIHVPVAVAFIWKFGWEFFLAGSLMGTQSKIAHSAHVGGALFGLLYAMWRSRVANHQHQT